MRSLTGLALLGSLFVAACGGSGSSGAPQATTSPLGVAAVAATSSKFGQILVDGQGKTLYLFQLDKTSSPTCYGSCVALWPPFLTSAAPMPGSGIDATKLSTTRRTDGTTQVTYAGHPLYEYVGDTKAGDTTGEAINSSGGLWYVVSVTGSAVTGG
jgi:predicted lipoprotein with Yx(FWY)xxD motif